MIKSYYFKKGFPVKMVTKDMGNTIDDTKTGWIVVDLKNFVKPDLQKIDGVWKIIETATQDEINEFINRRQIDYIDNLNKKFKEDGKEYQRYIKNKVTIQLAGRQNIIPILTEINKTVYVLLNKISAGDWALAMVDYLDNKNNPTIQEVKDLFDEVGQKSLEYYQNEYPH